MRFGAFNPGKHIAESLIIKYHTLKLSGRGIIEWNRKQGFRIETSIKSNSKIKRLTFTDGGPGLVPKAEFPPMRLRLGNGEAVYIPRISNLWSSQFIWNRWATLRATRAIMFRRLTFKEYMKGERWHGEAVMRLPKNTSLPGTLKTTKFIDGEQYSKHINSEAFRYKTSTVELQGRLRKNVFLELTVALDKVVFPKRSDCWQWIEGYRLALSILLGANVQIISREAERCQQAVTELNKDRGPIRTHWLVDFVQRHGHEFNPDLAAFLAEKFVWEKQTYDLCSNTVFMLFDATRQKRAESEEFLFSTLLEAFLRTWSRKPFSDPANDNWSVDRELKMFREEHWPRPWKKTCNEALAAHRRLRHRNAHPDWLNTIWGSAGEESKQQALDDMRFLSRFYGYMMLAVSGICVLEPIFPKPTLGRKTISVTIERDSEA